MLERTDLTNIVITNTPTKYLLEELQKRGVLNKKGELVGEITYEGK